MIWARSPMTGHHVATMGSRNIRVERTTWGNSKDPAWEIFIDGNPHGKELTIRDAKLEAEREVRIMDHRAGF